MRDVKRFAGNWSLFWTLLVSVLALIALGYYKNGATRYLLYGAMLGAGMMVYMAWSTASTYLEVRDARTLINRGHRTVGDDTVDIYAIRYIYRASAFVWKSWGSLMIIYVKDKDGSIIHSNIRERNYEGETLKAYLIRVKELNSDIELDEDYVALVEGRIEPQAFTAMPAKRTPAELEAILRTKGEVW